jgi:hypothetical protein
MMDTEARPLVIYHGNCADGFSAAWCFWRYHRDTADYVGGVYQTPPPDVTDRDVYLVDFSYKRAVVADMLTKAARVTLIDHHKTAIEDLAGLEGLRQYTDLDRSGATLAWDFLFPGEDRPLLLGHIEAGRHARDSGAGLQPRIHLRDVGSADERRSGGTAEDDCGRRCH